MKKMQHGVRTILGALLISLPGIANANLIDNGTFDTDVDGWDQSGTIPTTWNAATQTAWVGAPGFDGNSIFSQDFNIRENADHLKIWFDYQWQDDPIVVQDVFTVQLEYMSLGGTEIVDLLIESSAGGLFNAYTAFHANVDFVDLVAGNSTGTLRFELVENGTTQPRGTRIQLDNVEVKVPEPGMLALFGLGLLGFGFTRRKVASA